MKVAQAGLLIMFGLGVLWLAVTGRLDRIGSAFSHVVQGKDLPHSSGLDIEGAAKDYIRKQQSRGSAAPSRSTPPIANLDDFVSPILI